MTRRSQTKSNTDGGYRLRAKQRWGASPPDWVVALSNAADAEAGRGGSLTSLASRIGLTGGQVSGVIGKTYPAGAAMRRIEATVRGQLMKAEVQCPATGMVIGRDQCARYQRQKFSAASPLAMRLARTCPTCTNAIGSKK